ncbi:2-succinyl-5-enolpyruvyl-6-hydroxy-3-cyclohexene-1-carboxylic-acid synthase [bacterium]|nr:2-succinyl-5-enolpyruvyl-6-hydroxy-3-cyclohexene-1-carboxylic-acid synthase [bacterium]
MTSFGQSIVNIAEICAQHKISNVIISPGSRSAPLALAFLRHPKLKCRAVVDERSAAFIALGMAQQIGAPVVLVCTSGTATLNYGPAVAEAFYQRIPLIVFTADRPPEWIDQNDGQTIHQQNMFDNFCRASFDLPVETKHPDAEWQVARSISEAVNLCRWPIAGPVHLNVPLREPLYPTNAIEYTGDAKIILNAGSEGFLSEQIWAELLSAWYQATNKLVIAGMHTPSRKLSDLLVRLQDDETVAVLHDVTSNLHESQQLPHSDMILGTQVEAIKKALRPDLVFSFGGPVISKNLKLFLRKYKPDEHWQIDPAGQTIDTFQSLTRILPVTPENFLTELVRKNAIPNSSRNDSVEPKEIYRALWLSLESRAADLVKRFLSDLPHCELSAMQRILTCLPVNGNLQLGNSFIVRLASFIGLSETEGLTVNSNRGTSGIDGTVSTAVAAALANPQQMTTLIVGDLAFFYDRNALWNNYVPPNLRIIVINNDGGGIFRILDGPDKLPELDEHFEVAHGLTAVNTAKDHNLVYLACDSSDSLVNSLERLFESQDRAAILEVHTDKHVNAETFLKFKSIMREIT